MGLNDALPLIRRGEPVIEGVPNRVFEALDANIRYVWSALQAASIGSTVFARGVTVETAAAVGMPVYFNANTAQFERCLATFTTDLTTGTLLAAPSAGVWGVVYSKASATLADLLLFGLAPLDLGAAVSGAPTAGTYYLSGTTLGQLTRNRPALAVPVLRSDGAGNVFVSPTFVDALDRHTHYHFSLTAAPAGTTTPPVPGDHHVITAADPSVPGWLPATDPVFNDLAPEGAVFGYNWSAQPSLRSAWPPVPATQALLAWNKGLTKDVGATDVPPSLCVIDRNGIWWLTSCYGDVPWPVDLDTSSPTSFSASVADECPRHLEMSLDLWFTRPNFATDLATVTSLHSNDVRVKVTCYGTSTPAAVGDLQLALDFALAVSPTLVDGGTALKQLVGGNTFQAGWLTEGVYALTDNIALTGTHTRKLVTADLDSPTVYQGLVGLSVTTQPTLELDVQLVRLSSVTEELLFDLMYLGMAKSIDSSVRCKLYVPSDATVASPSLILKLRLLGRAVGSLPALTVSARRVPANSPIGTPHAFPDASHELAVTIDTTGTLLAANTYIEAQSEPFTVAAGDLVFFTVERSATDGYNGDVGIIHMSGLLRPA